MRRLIVGITLLLTLAACGNSPAAIQTAVARTQAAEQATIVALAHTATAAAPTATASPSATLTVTASPLPTGTPTATATPTETATPEPSATPTNTVEPTATPTNTRPPVTLAPPTATVPPTQPGPDFVTSVIGVREQVKNIGWQIDLAVRSGFIDCQQVIDSYEYVFDRRELAVGPDLAVAGATYQSATNLFHSQVKDLYAVCYTNKVLPQFSQLIGPQQWATARASINDIVPLLDQAIREAGGTP
ncbi:MAG: hypothetical protein IT317_05545 [Anaerolineales bacterium]|nr:hypothetical protein [Anaerolineales bacterium]